MAVKVFWSPEWDFYIPPCHKSLASGGRPGLAPGTRIFWHCWLTSDYWWSGRISMKCGTYSAMAGSSFRFVYIFYAGIFEALGSSAQCWEAGAENRGAKIKLPGGAGAKIMNCSSGSSSCSFLFTTDLKKFYWKKSLLLKENFVNWCNFNYISQKR